MLPTPAPAPVTEPGRAASPQPLPAAVGTAPALDDGGGLLGRGGEHGARSVGIGATITGTDHGCPVWGRVVAEEATAWRLDSGRVAKKKTEGQTWNWRATSAIGRPAPLQTQPSRKHDASTARSPLRQMDISPPLATLQPIARPPPGLTRSTVDVIDPMPAYTAAVTVAGLHDTGRFLHAAIDDSGLPVTTETFDVPPPPATPAMPAYKSAGKISTPAFGVGVGAGAGAGAFASVPKKERADYGDDFALTYGDRGMGTGAGASASAGAGAGARAGRSVYLDDGHVCDECLVETEGLEIDPDCRDYWYCQACWSRYRSTRANAVAIAISSAGENASACVNDDAVVQIIAMGFSIEDAASALLKSSGDVSLAINALLDPSSSQDMHHQQQQQRDNQSQSQPTLLAATSGYDSMYHSVATPTPRRPRAESTMAPAAMTASPGTAGYVASPRRAHRAGQRDERSVVRLAKQTLKGDWVCPNAACGDLVFGYRTVCNLCGTCKPGYRGPPEPAPAGGAPGDWVCPKASCGDVVFARRNKCGLCGTPRPARVFGPPTVPPPPPPPPPPAPPLPSSFPTLSPTGSAPPYGTTGAAALLNDEQRARYDALRARFPDEPTTANYTTHDNHSAAAAAAAAATAATGSAYPVSPYQPSTVPDPTPAGAAANLSSEQMSRFTRLKARAAETIPAMPPSYTPSMAEPAGAKIHNDINITATTATTNSIRILPQYSSPPHGGDRAGNSTSGAYADRNTGTSTSEHGAVRGSAVDDRPVQRPLVSNGGFWEVDAVPEPVGNRTAAGSSGAPSWPTNPPGPAAELVPAEHAEATVKPEPPQRAAVAPAAESEYEPDENGLTIGCAVIISELRAKPELNGVRGTVISKTESGERWIVKVDDTIKTLPVALKASALTVVAAAWVGVRACPCGSTAASSRRYNRTRPPVCTPR